MKKYILTLFAVAVCLISSLPAGAQTDNAFFPLPQVPEEMVTLTQRSNYFVYNFWERCNIKQSFSSLGRLNEAFGTWASLMPYASRDTVMMSIDNYIKAVEKADAKSLPQVGKMAQNWFFCDTAQYFSEELYLPFCRAMTKGKKVDKADKARYQAQLKILESSGLGQKVPDFTFYRPDGSTGHFGDILASRVILFFNDPDCTDCTLAKSRLSADYNTAKLAESNLVKVVSIYPGEPTEQWKEEAARYPDWWVVGAFPDADEMFDLSEMPQLIWLDGKHVVKGKNIPIDNLLYLVREIQEKHSQSN